MTIEELESQFIPCDITPDMYDTDVDDYTLFLAETFRHPVATDDVEIEPEQDPDFVYQVRQKIRSNQPSPFDIEVFWRLVSDFTHVARG